MRSSATYLIPILAVQLMAMPLPAADRPVAGASAEATTEQSSENSDQLKQELEQLKRAVALLEKRLEAQEKQQKPAVSQAPAAVPPATVPLAELTDRVKELDTRVLKTERDTATDRLKFSGDYRFEASNIRGDVPAHFDGIQLQNLVVRSMFAMPILGRPPASVAEINKVVNSNYSQYQLFTNNLTFNQVKQAMGSMPASLQQSLMGMLMPSTYVPAYQDNNNALFTNRLRLKFDSRISENMSFTGRLSMYKVFGDSTGVQVFNGQPTSLNVDGTTSAVPNSDQVRVDRAYFSWNDIGGSKLYLSIGRRPSTGGPPMNYREDELRGGTPSGALIDYQFDGITVGYRLSENMIYRLCWGLGYESGFGNGNLLKMPQDRLKDTHFLGANLDLWTSDTALVQATYAHAYNVPDGFSGMMVMSSNPLTGEAVGGPVVMRYTPSANLGGIDLLGFNLTKRVKSFDLYGSANWSFTHPNGITTPFGGLMSDPYEMPVARKGWMMYGGARYNFANDERTKIGFEFNHGSKYWFNFAQAADDIVAPKTNTRGNVVEAYLTHRINDRFILKGDFIKYLYDYSGSGWHVGAPKALDSNPVLGFPTYNGATKLSIGLLTRF